MQKHNLSNEQIEAITKICNRLIVLAAAVAVIGLTGKWGLCAVGVIAFIYLLVTKG